MYKILFEYYTFLVYIFVFIYFEPLLSRIGFNRGGWCRMSLNDLFACIKFRSAVPRLLRH